MRHPNLLDRQDTVLAIIDLQSGQAVDGAYACSELTAATDRNGKAYLRLKLRDGPIEKALIFYERPDAAAVKESTVALARLEQAGYRRERKTRLWQERALPRWARFRIAG